MTDELISNETPSEPVPAEPPAEESPFSPPPLDLLERGSVEPPEDDGRG